MITRESNKVTCPGCGHEDEIPQSIFDGVLGVPWVSHLSGIPIAVPLKCPNCEHEYTEDFVF